MREGTRLKNFKIFFRKSSRFFIFFISCTTYYFLIDFGLTKFLRLRGYHEFFESNVNVGFINKRNFEGRFGGPLDEFNNKVTTNSIGNRNSLEDYCKNKINNKSNLDSELTESKILFVGDSQVAGYEVADDETYVALLNQNCLNNTIHINGGVRAHNTHMAMANLKRILFESNLDNSRVKYIYMLTTNDFKENNLKNSYKSMKALFGSIYDFEFYQPYENPIKLNAKKIISRNFYFTKKFRRRIISLKNISKINNNQKHIQFKGSLKKLEKNKQECIRVKNIVEKVINDDDRINKIYIGVHPGFSKNSVRFLISNLRKNEECLNSALGKNKSIEVLPISKALEKTKFEKDNTLDFKFAKDSHYNKKGHSFFAEILRDILHNN